MPAEPPTALHDAGESARRAGGGPPDPLRAALAQLTEGVIVADAAGRITFVNDAAARLHGVARLDVAPEAYAETYHLLTEDGRPYPTADIPLARAVLRGETVLDARWRIRRPDGTEILAVGSARPVLAPDGTQVGAVLTMRDETLRAAATAAMRERDALAERLRAAFEQSPVSTVVYDASGRPLATNPAFERLWGAAIADVPHDYSVLTDPQLEAAGVLPLIRRAFAGEALTLPPLRYEMESAVGRGRVLWTQAHLYPVFDPSGAIDQVVLTHEDVTARREAEAALAESAARTARLQSLTAALAAATTRDAVAEVVVAQGVAAAHAASGMLALRDPARPDEAVIVRHAGLTDVVMARYARFRVTMPGPAAECIRTGAPIWAESRDAVLARFPEIPDVWESLSTHALATVPLLVAGETVGAMSFTFSAPRTFTDEDRGFFLTLAQQCAQALERARLFGAERDARAQVEQLNAELRRAVTDLEAVLDVVPIGIGIARDPDCRDIRVNPAFARQLGIAREVNASKSGEGAAALSFRVVHDGREVPPEELIMQRAARERRTIGGLEYDVVHPDGRVVRLLEFAAPLVDEAGAVRGAVGVFVDITERAQLVEAERAARAAAEAARAEAEAANRAKGEFLAVMSHELRTPLNAIGGYAELLEMGIRGPVTPQQVEDLERIQRSQRHLLGLINEVLNYAKLETGTVRYDVAAVGVAGTVAAVESLVLPQVREKALALDTAGCDPRLVVRADAEKLQQILVNLLSNAIKFTDRGGRVEVACRAEGAAVVLTERDTGVGIPADKLEAIFEPFVQVGRALNSPGEGTGLGLAISRDLARGMGGDLTVESAPGSGSTFTLLLPGA